MWWFSYPLPYCALRQSRVHYGALSPLLVLRPPAIPDGEDSESRSPAVPVFTMLPFVCQHGRVTEHQLDGGIANAGQVVRVGPHVLRPSNPHSESIHAFLRAVRHAGFEGATFPVGIDEDGRERLKFIRGEVPLPPYPDWSQSDAALASIAKLLRGLHDAARRFDPHGLSWDESLSDPAGGTLVCHNDVCPENVVFRVGIAVALLDFEFAAPGRPVTTSPTSPASACRLRTMSTRRGSAGDPPIGRHGYDSSPTPTDWTVTVGQTCSRP